MIKNSNRPSTYKRISQGQKRTISFMNRRRGDLTKVSKLTGFALSTVSEVLSGKYDNTRIINAAYEIARHRKGALA
jgi:predicted transcriptional regulator